MKRLFFALLAVSMIALPISAAVGLPFLGTAMGIGTISALTPSEEGVALAGLNKEIWLSDLMEGFYADDMFLSEVRNMDSFVENNKINLAEAGVNPDVLINTSYPMAPGTERTDTPLSIELDIYDTENTRILNARNVELAYDKRESVLYGHRQALRMKFMEYAAYNYAPATDSTYTPVVATTGATDDGFGNKALTWKDMRNLQTRFDNAEIPQEGRIIIFSQQHMNDLETEDLDRYNRVMDKGVICTFKIYKLANKRLPRYNRVTGAKVAWGAAAIPSTDVHASIAFHKDEVMRARGDLDLFFKEKDTEIRGDEIGFQMRGAAMPIRNKGLAAIYSEKIDQSPVIDGITPDPVAPAATITITGVKFTGASAVNFGSTPGTSLAVINDTELTVDVPTPLVDNTYDVTVVTAAGTSNIVQLQVVN